MRTLRVLWAITAGLLGLTFAGAVQAQDYPYCVVAPGGYGSGYASCEFTSLAQCQATASGDRSICQVNPRYVERPYGASPDADRSGPQRAPARRRD